MWIMLTKKIPTRPSPPMLSLFWSTPWPDDVYAPVQARTCMVCGTLVSQDNGKEGVQHRSKRYNRKLAGYCDCPGGPVFPTAQTTKIEELYGPGFSPNYIGARRIHFCEQDIRVFPHEFSAVSPSNMRAYVLGENGEPPDFELVAETSAEDTLIKGILQEDDKSIYDAALMDGCTKPQALATALGMDITVPDAEFPPLGWYRPLPGLSAIFCEEWEAKEDR